MIASGSVAQPSTVDSLLDLAASVTGVPRDVVVRLGETLIAEPPDGSGPRGGRSGLNYDQSPIQLCFSSGPEGLHCRLLADPALELADPVQRLDASYAAMTRTVELTSSPAMRPFCDRTLQLHLPDHAIGPDDYPDGILWIAAGVDTPGMAMYVDARRGGDELAWPRLRNWFAALLPDMSEADRALDVLRGRARLMCLGVEGAAPSNARAKLYWRLGSASPLSAIGIDRFRDPRFQRFLEIVMRERRIRLTGVVPSAGFKIDSGALSDVKLDVCACPGCLDWPAHDWSAIVSALGAEFGFASLPVAEWLAFGEMAFIGFGLDGRGGPRLNIYLKPLRSAA